MTPWCRQRGVARDLHGGRLSDIFTGYIRVVIPTENLGSKRLQETTVLGEVLTA